MFAYYIAYNIFCFRFCLLLWRMESSLALGAGAHLSLGLVPGPGPDLGVDPDPGAGRGLHQGADLRPGPGEEGALEEGGQGDQDLQV